MSEEELLYASGSIGTEWYIHQPLLLGLERDAAGWYIVSDLFFMAFGHALTLAGAHADYLTALGEFCTKAKDAAERHPENMPTYRRLLEYVRPVGDSN